MFNFVDGGSMFQEHTLSHRTILFHIPHKLIGHNYLKDACVSMGVGDLVI